MVVSFLCGLGAGFLAGALVGFCGAVLLIMPKDDISRT